MNPNLQEILHNITSRLAVLEQNAESDKLLIDLIQEQRKEIDKLRKHWIGLTDEELNNIPENGNTDWMKRKSFARAIEKLLMEKNGG